MQISSQDLKRIPVVTESGSTLGFVRYFDIDSDTGHILRYFIRQFLSLSGILVHHSQVIEITRDKIIISDASIKERLSIFEARKRIRLTNTDPVISKTK